MDRASFGMPHAERLVGSLVAETGLPEAAARALTDDVLDRALARGTAFTCDAEAYAWLRVAARRRALDLLRGELGPDESWAAAAEAADAALLRSRGGAARVVAALPPAQRAVLRLRYVEGLLPATIAERLGLPVEEVEARLAEARGAAARALAPVPARRSPVLRTAARRTALAAAAVAAAAVAIGGMPDLVRTPGVGGALAAPRVGAAPEVGTPTFLPPEAVAPGTRVAAVRPAVLAAGVAGRNAKPGTFVVDVDDDGDGPGDRCTKNCLGGPGLPTDDDLQVDLPQPAAELTGEGALVIEGEKAPLCKELPTKQLPSTVARCVPHH